MIAFVRGCGFGIADSPTGQWLKIAGIEL